MARHSAAAKWIASAITGLRCPLLLRVCGPRRPCRFATWRTWPRRFRASSRWRDRWVCESPNQLHRGGAMKHVPVMTIDGPSGSGKGTVSRAVAHALGWALLDSGALYRLVALAARKAGVSLEDGPGLAALAEGLVIKFGSHSAGGGDG